MEDLATDAFDVREAHESALVAGVGAAHPEDTPHSPVPLVPIKVFVGAALAA